MTGPRKSKKKVRQLSCDCPYCGSTHRSLEIAWKHVQATHPTEHADRVAEFERVHKCGVCNWCGGSHDGGPEHCAGDDDDMAKRKAGKGKTFDKLDVKALGKSKGGTVKLTEHVQTMQSGDFGTSELFRATYGGKTWSFFVRHGSGNHKRLIREYGKSPKRWAGNSVDVERKTFKTDDGRKVPYLAIV